MFWEEEQYPNLGHEHEPSVFNNPFMLCLISSNEEPH